MILPVKEIRKWDEFTIQAMDGSSTDLMQRAASKVAGFVQEQFSGKSVAIFCGKGNNGGDGLAVGYMLNRLGFRVSLFLCQGKEGSPDFKHFLRLCEQSGVTMSESFLSDFKADVWVDALLGTGVDRPVEGALANWINHYNTGSGTKIAIDIPSGLFGDEWEQGKGAITKNDVTITFQCLKWAFANPESIEFTGRVNIVDIGLNPDFKPDTVLAQYLGEESLDCLIPKRKLNAEKRDFGEVLILGGNIGMAGALAFAAKAAFSCGAGLVKVCSPKENRAALQSLVPEATWQSWEGLTQKEISKYSSVLIGPGLGLDKQAKDLVKLCLTANPKKLILDADAINILAKDLGDQTLPKGSVLTPHTREFKRLCGDFSKEKERLFLQKEFCKKHAVTFLYKGPKTCVCEPNGELYINASGNPALAKGGSGDVLSGIIAAFVNAIQPSGLAAASAAFVHGKIADVYIQHNSELSLRPEDQIEGIPKMLKSLFA
ncbi:MAG: NAD(P)H-hydrate dehydratase [Luteibaculum sp.]